MNSKSNPGSSSAPPSGADPMRDSAHQIWLAGLGAFTKAQQEGGKVFEALVQEGLTMQHKAQTSAEAKLAQASEKISSMAQELGGRATGQWDKLEGLFEERVARALPRLGIPSAHDVALLTARVAELERRLQASATRSTPAKKTAPARKTTVRKAARKTAG